MNAAPSGGGTLLTGREAEETACRHLAGCGLTLLERNFRRRGGEIDLVMQDGDCIVFVEVRYRRGVRFGSALESVDGRKQAKLILAAQSYLQLHEAAGRRSARFDVVSVGPGANGARVEWIKDAFRA